MIGADIPGSRMVHSPRSVLWCADCINFEAFECESCCDLFDAASNDCCWIGGNRWCRDCRDENTIYCETCDEDHHVEEGVCAPPPLHEYDYVPELHFYGEGPAFFGVEVEMEAENTSSDTLASFIHQFDEGERHFYCKRDGSLDDGVEVVTHPHSLDAFRSVLAPQLARAFSSASRCGAAAWTRTSCGLHVHISGEAFASDSHRARFFLMFSRNENEVVRFARRRSDSYASISGMRDQGSVIGKSKGANHDRYNAVHPTHHGTVEVRIFRSSLAVGRVVAAVEFCHALVTYTAGISGTAATLSWSAFVDWMRASGDYPCAVRASERLNFIVTDNSERAF
jgi:hypothetical protein